VVFLHFLRVFYTSAFASPRQFNWIIGLGLFSTVVLSNFTGYLLPWDQLAYWAITISTSMLDYIPLLGTGLKQWILGGPEPGSGTLTNFYAIHTALLPALLLFLVPFHFWRIRKANGLVVPRSPEEEPTSQPEMVKAVPHLITRDVALILIVFATVMIIAMVFDAPLTEQANPGLSPNPTKAPWYFMGIQELLMHFHPIVALLLIPALLILGLFSIPYINYEANSSGVWFCSHKGRKMALIAVVLAILATVAAVLMDEFIFSVRETGPAGLIRNGLLPFSIVLVICTGFYVLMKKGFNGNNNEAIQALFTLLLTSFVVLTVIGVWFRGPGMQLMWAS
jgi:quinol-cytochrome oxidoreductase complex cytochrome b subunit